MDNIYAFTEIIFKGYPGYISLNKLGPDKYELTVRARDSQDSAIMPLCYRQLKELQSCIQSEILNVDHGIDAN